MSLPKDIEFKKDSMAALFESLANPDPVTGVSREVHLNEFTGDYEPLGKGFGNGAAWARSDGSLARKYIVQRHKLKNKVVSIELMGYQRTSAAKRNIPTLVREALRDKPCVITGTSSGIEIDHKFGRYEGQASDSPDDYQPLHKSVNNAKRSHCRACKTTDERFDARMLGYKRGWTKGGIKFFSCYGCYWHDPVAFNRAVSENA